MLTKIAVIIIGLMVILAGLTACQKNKAEKETEVYVTENVETETVIVENIEVENLETEAYIVDDYDK